MALTGQRHSVAPLKALSSMTRTGQPICLTSLYPHIVDSYIENKEKHKMRTLIFCEILPVVWLKTKAE